MTLAGAFAQAAPRAGERVRFRAAEANDAASCGSLVFASGVAEFGFFSAKAMRAASLSCSRHSGRAMGASRGAGIASRSLKTAPCSP